LVFFHLSKLPFSGFLHFKGNFVRDQNNSKYRDWAPLKVYLINLLYFDDKPDSKAKSQVFQIELNSKPGY
jgi:hypothetical protein